MPRDDAVPPTPARHSLLQIFVGASIGFPLGVAAFWCDPHGRLLQKPLKVCQTCQRIYLVLEGYVSSSS